MTEVAPEQLGQTAADLAQAAGAQLLQWFRHLDEADVRFKGRRNPVTEADLASERLLVGELERRHPGHAILAEEGGIQGGDAEYQWIVDPLDGTVNFRHGLPAFAVSIGVRRRDQLLAGAIFLPALDELYTAVRGAGARLNGHPIQVSTTTELSESLLATGFCYERNEVADNNVRHFTDLVLEVRDLRRVGSAAVDFAWTAAGRYDAFWELHLSPWDVAAGALLVQEAGGRVTDLRGEDRMVERGHFLASNGPLHEPLLEVLQRPGLPLEDGGPDRP